MLIYDRQMVEKVKTSKPRLINIPLEGVILFIVFILVLIITY